MNKNHFKEEKKEGAEVEESHDNESGKVRDLKTINETNPVNYKESKDKTLAIKKIESENILDPNSNSCCIIKEYILYCKLY